MIASGDVRPHPMLIRRTVLNELAADLLHPMRDPSCDGSVGQLRSRRRAAAPLVKPTLRGILPHGSEVPRGPIPLRSTGLDDSPCYSTMYVGCVEDKSPFPPDGGRCV
jgi:hypothetical protein